MMVNNFSTEYYDGKLQLHMIISKVWNLMMVSNFSTEPYDDK